MNQSTTSDSSIKDFLYLTKDATSDFIRALGLFAQSVWLFIVAIGRLVNPAGPTGRFAFVLGGWGAFFGIAFVIVLGAVRLFK